MQTFLIVSTNESYITANIEKITKKLRLSLYNTHELIPSPSIGIDAVRKIQQIMSRKVYGGGQRLILIRNFEKSTTETANALLKILEEPTSDTYIILTASNLDIIIPTVASRCQVYTDRTKHEITDDNQEEKSKMLLLKLVQSSPGERILLSLQSASSKDDVYSLLQSLIHTAEQLLHQQNGAVLLTPLQLTSIIKKVQAAKRFLDGNVNLKATLDILFLGFPYIDKKRG